MQRWFVALPPQLQYSEARFQRGDDARWSQASWNDDDWAVKGYWDLPARAGIDWVRFRVRMGEDGKLPLPAEIMISTVRSYQIFWDGVQLGGSGRPGNDAENEGSGRVDEWFSIPAALRGPGEHVVALRTSSYRCGFPAATSGFRFLIDEPQILHGKVLREAFLPTLAAGALCMTGLACLIMWLLAARRSTLLLLCGVCFTGAAMQGLQAVRWFFAYPADWHYPVTSSMAALVGVQGVLTVIFVFVHFAAPGRRWLLAALVPVFSLVAWTSPERANLEGVRILSVGIGLALACSVWAVWRRRRGAWPAAIGVAVSALLLLMEAEDYRASFFLKFSSALVGLISSLALQLRDERRDARAAQLAAARLEAELLKKNMQPHFLLNTLAVLTEIVEREPARAVSLIDDLADELRTVARVSAEKLIPLAQELALCRAHLRVMSVRMGRESTLATVGTDEAALVPPAVFLTLIENGFAHQRTTGGGATVFALAQERTENGARRYVFLSPGDVQADPGRPPGGTGLRYVKARLEESFPGGWTFADGPVATGWQTVIELASPPKGDRV
ncbi:MAG: histidine kinase [Nibricoccus sp.]